MFTSKTESSRIRPDYTPSEEELLELCGDEGLKNLNQYKYWPTEVYGMGHCIRKYGYYPRHWPLHIMTDHSPTLRDWVTFDMNFNAPVQFYHSPALVQEWKKISKKPCHVIYSPFAFYRRKNKIEQSATAEGTLVFPTHNSHHLKDKSDLDAYIGQLLALPADFQPFSVCMYFLDILEGKHRVFQKYNMPVYTAGNWLDPLFPKRFYEILRNFKYTTSNLPGSYLFYSVEMGIPFSLYGNKPIYVNESDTSIALGTYDESWKWPRVQEAVRLFQGKHTSITDEQKQWVETNMGIRDGISRLQMSKILYSTYWQYEGKPYLKSRYSRLKKRLKYFVK